MRALERGQIWAGDRATVTGAPGYGRDQLVGLAAGGQIAAGVNDAGHGWLELTTGDGASAMVELGEGELLMALEALAVIYAKQVGARPESLARGVNRTLRNRTRAARERRRLPATSEAAK